MMLAKLAHYIFAFYELGLLVYVISGWFSHPFTRLLRLWLGNGYETVLIRIRQNIPLPRFGLAAIDISPLILFLGIAIIRGLVISVMVPPF